MQTMTLPAALRETARRIESGEVAYAWDEMSACNCGIVARVILDVGPEELANRLFCEGPYGSWSGAVRGWRCDGWVCAMSDLPVTTVLGALAAAGLTPTDIGELEYLSNKAIRRRAGLLARSHFADHDHYVAAAVVAYLEAWAEMLSEVEEVDAPVEELELVGAA